jgi:hypothetical protein
MPTTSYPWKQQLLRQAETLHEIALPHRWGEASAVKLEETVVLGFYGIRRLINGFLLGEALVHHPIPMMAFPARRKIDTLIGEASFEMLYDLKSGRAVAHDLLFLCHQVIHNCVFATYFDQGKTLQGIYITSDHQRKVALYGIDLQAIEALFRRVGQDRPGTAP